MRPLILATVFVLGCSSSPKPIVAEEARIAPAPARSEEGKKEPPVLPEPRAPEPPAPVASATPDGGGRPQLGMPCAPGTRGCGKSGTIAFIVQTTSGYAVPGEVPLKPTCTPLDTSRGAYITRACVDGDRLFVSSVCIVCRISSDTTQLGVVSEMTPEQIDQATKLAALTVPNRPTTAAAWKSAIEAAAARVKKAP